MSRRQVQLHCWGVQPCYMHQVWGGELQHRSCRQLALRGLPSGHLQHRERRERVLDVWRWDVFRPLRGDCRVCLHHLRRGSVFFGAWSDRSVNVRFMPGWNILLSFWCDDRVVLFAVRCWDVFLTCWNQLGLHVFDVLARHVCFIARSLVHGGLCSVSCRHVFVESRVQCLICMPEMFSRNLRSTSADILQSLPCRKLRCRFWRRFL